MKQHKEIVLKAEEGIAFEITEGVNQQIIIKAFNIATTSNSANYANPPIPEGYKYVEGEWNHGFVIERKSDGSQFVWVPVGSLHKSEKQDLSVKKYGGFYISRYNISKSLEGKPESVRGVKPWVNITYAEAKGVAANMENDESVESHLTYDYEYNCILEWFIQSGAASKEELFEDSSGLGNYWNSKNSPRALAETGSCEEWCINSIYDFAGNVYEWTKEANKYETPVLRGGGFSNYGSHYPASYRYGDGSSSFYYVNIGFRVVLYIV